MFWRVAHEFLKWLPLATGGGIVAVGGVWDGARDWIALQAAWAWAEMSDPWITVFVGLAVAAYVVAILWTGHKAKALDHPSPDEESARFDLSIQQFMCNGSPMNGEHALIIIVTVKNIGNRASALPTWKVTVQEGDNIHTFVPTVFLHSITMSGVNGFEIAYGEDQAIVNKTASPVPSGAIHHGYIAAVSSDAWLGQLGPQHTLGVRCWDVFGNSYEATRSLGDGDNSSENMYFAGMPQLRGSE